MINRLNYDLYGSVVFNETKFTETLFRHTQEIKDYFSGRENDLLIMDITKGDGWEKLCPFLDKPIPSENIPKENVTKR